MPGSRADAKYAPAASEVKARASPLCTSVTVTVAPGITEPLWSETLPVMRPSSACGNAGRQINDSARVAPRTWIAFFAEARATLEMELIHPPNNVELIAPKIK